MHVHTVFFWLKEETSPEDRKSFEAGLSDLSSDPNVLEKHIGKPALTDRPVIDSSYDYGITFTFNDLDAHNVYQAGQAHLGFLDNCAGMWSRVQVYDLEKLLFDSATQNSAVPY